MQISAQRGVVAILWPPPPTCLFSLASHTMLGSLGRSYRVVFAHPAPIPDSLTTIIMLILGPDRTSDAGRHRWGASYKVLW